MRIRCTFAVAFLAFVGTFESGRADEKEDKEHRERLEKQLAEIEPMLEKEDWAVSCKKFIVDMKTMLDNANRVDLFRINPKPLSKEKKDGKKEFHGYEILTDFRLEPKEQHNRATAFLGSAFHWNMFRKAACFNPRHGVRIVSGNRTLDFLVCFECNTVQVFENEKPLGGLAMGFIDEKNPLEQLLQDNEKKQKAGKK